VPLHCVHGSSSPQRHKPNPGLDCSGLEMNWELECVEEAKVGHMKENSVLLWRSGSGHRQLPLDCISRQGSEHVSGPWCLE